MLEQKVSSMSQQHNEVEISCTVITKDLYHAKRNDLHYQHNQQWLLCLVML